jgi:hypothetical protein
MPETREPDPIPAEAAKPFRLLVTGSRSWDDEGVIQYALSEILFHNKTMILVHGACPTGADRIADEWAAARNMYPARPVTVERHPADWEKYGRAAGFRRNAEMVRLRADLCLAFILDASRGATHTADLAEKASIPVRRYERSSRDPR